MINTDNQSNRPGEKNKEFRCNFKKRTNNFGVDNGSTVQLILNYQLFIFPF